MLNRKAREMGVKKEKSIMGMLCVTKRNND